MAQDTRREVFTGKVVPDSDLPRVKFALMEVFQDDVFMYTYGINQPAINLRVEFAKKLRLPYLAELERAQVALKRA